MSSNKGKDGELRVAIILARIGQLTEGVDFIRPTTTNTADMGADLFLVHPQGYLDEFAHIATGTQSVRRADRNQNEHPSKQEKSRIDVKATPQKLQKFAVQKFVSDTHNHPECNGHILMGGAALTGPAKRELLEAKERFAKHGKTLLYLDNDGISRLEAHYQSRLPENLDTEL